MDSQELTDFKAQLRKQAFAERDLAWQKNPGAGEALKHHLIEALAMPPGLAISGYWPLPGEMDVRPALAHYHAEGHAVGLPVVTGRNLPLIFRRWNPKVELVQGSFRVMTPPDSAPAVIPSILLVPLLAFDPEGYRLGYGGGFYDRTLAKLRHEAHAVAVGVAYAVQEVPMVPRGIYDQPLDYVVTERAVFKFNRKSDL
ncbi:5-formyltetrahydrofolate cyclo-ligase [Dongia sp.]|uniref:5-formyltetrahydrofolate cyclo-ligase n=1 Tax=Dongia sp. TaxID=1977262 RepID=UPI0035B167BE